MELGRLKCTQSSLLCQSPSASEVGAAIGKLKRYKSPGVDQIPTQLIQAGEGTLHSEIYKRIALFWNKEFPHEREDPVVVPIHKKG
jgi:hypothetical protein